MRCLLRAIPCPALHFRRTPEVCLSKWEGDANSARVSSASFRCMSSFQKAAPTRNIQKKTLLFEGPASSQPDSHPRLQASIPPPGRARTPQPLSVQRTSRVTWMEVICGVDILRNEEGRFTGLVHALPPTHTHSQIYTPGHMHKHTTHAHTLPSMSHHEGAVWNLYNKEENNSTSQWWTWQHAVVAVRSVHKSTPFTHYFIHALIHSLIVYSLIQHIFRVSNCKEVPTIFLWKRHSPFPLENHHLLGRIIRRTY